MDQGLLGTIQKIKLTSYVRRCSDDDFVDRINNFYTPLLLTIFTIIICTRSYIVGEPLQCWVPIHFSDGWEAYSESWCYIKNTYYVPSKNEIPDEKILRDKSELQYYQWVPFVLGLQAVLFVIPSIFWKFTSFQAKLHLQPLIQRGVKSSFETCKKRLSTLKGIADHIRNCLFKSKFITDDKNVIRLHTNKTGKCCGLVNTGSFLTCCYLTTKCLYLANIVCQFIIVQKFLKTDLAFGFNLVSKFAKGLDWQGTGIFPRVTLCDFTIPRFGQPMSTTMQCVLVINLFNEKIYIFLWFWLAFLLIITAVSLVIWIGRMLFGRKLSSFVSIKSDYRNSKNEIILRNCESQMNCDAYFALRMIDSNCGMMTTRRIVEHILEPYNRSLPEEDISRTLRSMPPNYNDLDSNEKNSTYNQFDNFNLY